MKKNYRIIFLIILIVFSISNAVIAYNYNMSWEFEIFNKYSNRQIAIDIAEKQLDMVEKEEDAADQFQESFERRLMSTVQRSIIDQIFSESGITVGEYRVGDLDISVAEDSNTGEVILEITDIITGETTIVTYGVDYWLNSEYDYNY